MDARECSAERKREGESEEETNKGEDERRRMKDEGRGRREERGRRRTLKSVLCTNPLCLDLLLVLTKTRKGGDMIDASPLCGR